MPHCLLLALPSALPSTNPFLYCPAGYAILRYKGAKPAVPVTPPPAPGSVAPWTLEAQAKIVMNAKMLATKNKGAAGGVYREAMTQVRCAVGVVLCCACCAVLVLAVGV